MRRYEALDSLRGLCAVMVVLMHFPTSGTISSSALVQHSYLFVDFFFVLSGFVIASSYQRKLTQGFSVFRFMLLRLGRLYPLHLAVLGIFLLAEVAIALLASHLANVPPFTGQYSPALFVASLLLVQIFVGADRSYWNGPSWSIAAEVWTYLIFALIFRFAKGRWAACALAIACVAILYRYSPAQYHYLNDIHDGALLRCVFGFSIGVLIFHVKTRLRIDSFLNAATVVEMGAVLMCLFAISTVAGSAMEFAMPLLFGAAVLVFSFEGGLVSRLLTAKPFILLGSLSYSIYMIHDFLVFKVTSVLKLVIPSAVHLVHGRDIVGRSALAGDLASLSLLCLVIGCSWVSFRLIEKPARSWSRKVAMAEGRGAPAEAVAI